MPVLVNSGPRIAKGLAAMGTFRPGRVVTNPASEATTLLLLTIAPAESSAR